MINEKQHQYNTAGSYHSDGLGPNAMANDGSSRFYEQDPEYSKDFNNAYQRVWQIIPHYIYYYSLWKRFTWNRATHYSYLRKRSTD